MSMTYGIRFSVSMTLLLALGVHHGHATVTIARSQFNLGRCDFDDVWEIKEVSRRYRQLRQFKCSAYGSEEGSMQLSPHSQLRRI